MKINLLILAFFLLIVSPSQSLSKSNANSFSAPVENEKNNMPSEKKLRILLKSLNILNQTSVPSKKYKRMVTFLETRFYNNAHFDTLILLSDTYKKNQDFTNQMKVLTILVDSYPKRSKSYYELGFAYKNRFLKNKNPEDKEEAISNLSNAIKMNRKYSKAYDELFPLLKDENHHTKASLSLAKEMFRYIKRPKDYIRLCEAYFENKFLQQSRRACKKSIQKNPADPISHFLYALSQEETQKIKKMVLSTAKKFKRSFYVQSRTGSFIFKTNPSLGILYINRALKIQPNHLKLLKIKANYLFENQKIKESYDLFLKICILDRGQSIMEFRKISNKVKYKNKKLASLFRKGVEQCFKSVKSR